MSSSDFSDEETEWTKEEDKILLQHGEDVGPFNWSKVTKKLKGHSESECRARFIELKTPQFENKKEEEAYWMWAAENNSDNEDFVNITKKKKTSKKTSGTKKTVKQTQPSAEELKIDTYLGGQKYMMAIYGSVTMQLKKIEIKGLVKKATGKERGIIEPAFLQIIKNIFIQFDKNNDGALDIDEYNSYQKFVGQGPITETILKDLKNIYDFNDLGLTQFGFIQLFIEMCIGDEAEAWGQLEKFGYNKKLEKKN